MEKAFSSKPMGADIARMTTVSQLSETLVACSFAKDPALPWPMAVVAAPTEPRGLQTSRRRAARNSPIHALLILASAAPIQPSPMTSWIQLNRFTAIKT